MTEPAASAGQGSGERHPNRVGPTARLGALKKTLAASLTLEASQYEERTSLDKIDVLCNNEFDRCKLRIHAGSVARCRVILRSIVEACMTNCTPFSRL